MKLVKKIVVVAILSSVCHAFGQLNLSFKSEKLSEAINSEYSECAPVFSPDGNKMYFIRVNHPENRYGAKASQDIWVSEKKEGTWQKASRLPNSVNLGRYNAVFGVLPTGELLINGVYDKSGAFLERGVSKISVSDSTSGKPEKLRIKAYARKSKGGISSISIDATATKMFVSFAKRKSKKNNIYVATLHNGKWRKPKKLKYVNTGRSEETPFLSHDGSTLYFASNLDNKKNNFDVYSCQIADINEFTKWSKPVKIEGDINSDAYDGFFVLDPKEEYAYYTSQKDGATATEIYRLQVKDLRDYVHVKGFVVNLENGKPIDSNTPFTLEVTTQGTIGKSKIVALSNFKSVGDSSFFEFEIPFGANYVITAMVEGYEQSPVNLDLSAVAEFQELAKDAKVKAVPILTLTGKIEVTDGTNTNYDSTKIYANGELVQDAVINKDGTYSLNLPTGKLYKIEAKKPNHISFPVDVDVTKEKTKTARTANLKMEEIPENYATLSATVTNQKDSSIVDPSKYQVLINGKPVPKELITPTANGFDLRLDKGKQYLISIKTSDFIDAHDSVDFRKVKIKQVVNNNFVLVPLEVGATVKIEHIYFDLGKATLKKESFPELDRLVTLLKEHDHLRIEVSGHTDSKGNAYLNQKLSGERALSVKNYLIKQGGIDASRLESKGYGFSRPVSANDTEKNRAQNRRVEFTILAN